MRCGHGLHGVHDLAKGKVSIRMVSLFRACIRHQGLKRVLIFLKKCDILI